MYKIRFTNRDNEKCIAVIVANSEEEAIEIFHNEITKAEPEHIYKVPGSVAVVICR